MHLHHSAVESCTLTQVSNKKSKNFGTSEISQICYRISARGAREKSPGLTTNHSPSPAASSWTLSCD